MSVYIVTVSDQYCDHLMGVFHEYASAKKWIENFKFSQPDDENEIWHIREMKVRN